MFVCGILKKMGDVMKIIKVLFLSIFLISALLATGTDASLQIQSKSDIGCVNCQSRRCSTYYMYV